MHSGTRAQAHRVQTIDGDGQGRARAGEAGSQGES